MLEHAAELLDRLRAGERVVVATVVGVHGSAPRPVGSAMLVTQQRTVVGSVSGGCVEGAVFEAACLLLGDQREDGLVGGLGDGLGGEPLSFGYDEHDAFAVGLSCGGRVDVTLTLLDDDASPAVLDQVARAAAGEAAVLGVVVSGPSAGQVLAPDGPAPWAHWADGEVLVLTQPARPRFVVVGAADVAGALAELAAFAGYRVTVVDARATFATHERFPRADEVVVRWPHLHLADLDATGALDARTVVAVVTHDAKFDVPALAVALRSPAGFVGALGSRATQARRREELGALGLGDGDLARLHAPLGLDLGGSSPQETALSILAEVVAARTGRTGLPLRDLGGPIHPTVVAVGAAGPPACEPARPIPTR